MNLNHQSKESHKSELKIESRETFNPEKFIKQFIIAYCQNKNREKEIILDFEKKLNNIGLDWFQAIKARLDSDNKKPRAYIIPLIYDMSKEDKNRLLYVFRQEKLENFTKYLPGAHGMGDLLMELIDYEDNGLLFGSAFDKYFKN
ncbi:MAG: hypothetical protein ABIF17_05000 [Patescibacteria group bacterium]